MYERFYGLQQRPFELTTNPQFLYLSARHKEALSNLQYGISCRKGISVLIGEAGTGKTTIIRAALASFKSPHARVVYINNPLLTRPEFFELLASGFELSRDATTSKTRFLLELSRTLAERYDAGHLTALVIDEAQSLPHDLLEEVRLLANIEAATEKVLPVVLAGQAELAQRLNDVTLRQLKQRIGLRCVLVPLDCRETAAYIATRIGLAGGDVRRIFTPETVALIYQRSRGIPRVISVICDNALLGSFAVGKRPVDQEVVLEVYRDFDLQPLAPASQFGPERAEPAAPAWNGPPRVPGPSQPSPPRLAETPAAREAPGAEPPARNEASRVATPAANEESDVETPVAIVQPTTPFVLLPVGMV